MHNNVQDRTGGTHAIVVGAGISGIVAARILSELFDRVTLLDRDRLPEAADARRGVPQARHFHGMLVAGERLLQQLFPGIDADLAEAGAPPIDVGWDGMFFFREARLLRRRTGLNARLCSRSLREWTLRRRLARYPNVRVIDGCEVARLIGDGRGVTGVRLRFRGENGQQDVARDDTLHADLVVDASGRDSHSVNWLRDLGYPAPKISTVSSFLGYSTRLVRMRKEPEGNLKFIGVAPFPPDRHHGAMLSAVEGGHWIVTLIGAEGHSPPTDDAGFVEWTRDLTTPLVHQMLTDAELISPAHGYRRTENTFRHFEKMSRWPDGFVVLGDAATCFNPFYGQGMTVGAQSAVDLGELIREHRLRHPGGGLTGAAREFQKRLAKRVLPHWLLATGEDFRWPKTEGEQPPKIMRLLQKYADQAVYMAASDARAHQTFLEVQHGIKPGTALFDPRLAASVLQRAFKIWRMDAARA